MTPENVKMKNYGKNAHLIKASLEENRSDEQIVNTYDTASKSISSDLSQISAVSDWDAWCQHDCRPVLTALWYRLELLPASWYGERKNDVDYRSYGPMLDVILSVVDEKQSIPQDSDKLVARELAADQIMMVDGF
jgi:hypothetical protein